MWCSRALGYFIVCFGCLILMLFVVFQSTWSFYCLHSMLDFDAICRGRTDFWRSLLFFDAWFWCSWPGDCQSEKCIIKTNIDVKFTTCVRHVQEIAVSLPGCLQQKHYENNAAHRLQLGDLFPDTQDPHRFCTETWCKSEMPYVSYVGRRAREYSEASKCVQKDVHLCY